MGLCTRGVALSQLGLEMHCIKILCNLRGFAASREDILGLAASREIALRDL
jgi:hypothetical protein